MKFAWVADVSVITAPKTHNQDQVGLRRLCRLRRRAHPWAGEHHGQDVGLSERCPCTRTLGRTLPEKQLSEPENGSDQPTETDRHPTETDRIDGPMGQQTD